MMAISSKLDSTSACRVSIAKWLKRWWIPRIRRARIPRRYAAMSKSRSLSSDGLRLPPCRTGNSYTFRAPAHIGRELAERSIAVLRFDFAGLGNSGGDFAATNFTSNVADVIAAVAFLRERFAAPKILIGHSLGGTAILAAAPQIPEACAVVTIGAPYQPSHAIGLLGASRTEI